MAYRYCEFLRYRGCGVLIVDLSSSFYLYLYFFIIIVFVFISCSSSYTCTLSENKIKNNMLIRETSVTKLQAPFLELFSGGDDGGHSMEG